MSSRRTLILIGALLVGGLAAFLTLTYVRGIENRAGEDSALVDVVVASAPIAKGQAANEAIQAQTIGIAQRPRKTVPANAVRRLADIEGQVAAIDLGGGEVVTTSMFGSTAALTGSKAAALEPGNVAITVQVDSASVSGGLIQPGDLVNLLAQYKVLDPAGTGGGAESPALSTSGGNGANLGKPSGYLMQAVKVFAVGTDAGATVASTVPAGGPSGASGESGSAAAPQANTSTYLTVQLPPDQAALLASVRDAQLYASLVPPDYKPQPFPLVTQLPALPGELGQTPYPSTKPNQ